MYSYVCTNHGLSIDTIHSRANIIWPVGPFKIFLLSSLSWKRLGVSIARKKCWFLFPRFSRPRFILALCESCFKLLTAPWLNLEQLVESYFEFGIMDCLIYNFVNVTIQYRWKYWYKKHCSNFHNRTYLQCRRTVSISMEANIL
jgi:hypothetical protein